MTSTYEYYKNYAINYYLRYYPSIKKLENKLLDKTKGDIEIVSKIIWSFSESVIKEKEVIEAKIAFYISRNKKLSYIRNKLIEKLFKKEDIEEILSSKFDLENTLLSKDLLFRKVENYKNKWKSRKYIYMNLFDRKEDIELINQVLYEVFWDNSEDDNLKQEFEKLLSKWIEKQKIIEKLLRKGFSYDDIKKLF